MPVVGSLLVQNKVVGVIQVEEALQRQVIFGGDLATNLLEIGVVDEQVLNEYSARAMGIPALAPKAFDDPDSEVMKSVPWHFVNAHRFLPIRIADGIMVVAVSERLSGDLLEDLSFLLGAKLEQRTVLEFRLMMGLNRHYGIPIPVRFEKLHQRLAPEFEPNRPPTVTPPKSGQKEILSGSDPGRPAVAVDGEVRQSMIFRVGEPVPARRSEEAEQAAARPEPSPSTDEPKPDQAAATAAATEKSVETTGLLPLSEALKALDAAPDRDSILSLATKFASQMFKYVALFVVHGDAAHGRSAKSAGMKEQKIDRVEIPLDRGGMFETVFKTQSPFLGPAGGGETDVEALGKMGREKPRNCAVLPVSVRNRTVMIVYGDSGDSTIPADRLPDLVHFFNKVGQAFERLLLQQKYKGYRQAPKAEEVKAKPMGAVRLGVQGRSETEAEDARAYHSVIEAMQDAAPKDEEPAAEPLAKEETAQQERHGKSEQRSVVVDMKEEVGHLVDRIVSQPRFDKAAAELLAGIGEDALVELVRRFPGPLNYDRHNDPGPFPEIDQIGPLLKTIVGFGNRAAQHVVPLTDSADPEIRFYAVLVLSKLTCPEAVAAMVPRIFDKDRQIGAAAADAIKRCEKHPEYRRAIGELVQVLSSSSSNLEAKRTAAKALGGLKESSAIAPLANMLGSVDSALAEICHQSLVKIAFDDLGFSTKKWMSWLKSNRKKHRIEWAIEALGHSKESIRNVAAKELRAYVADAVEWPADALDPKQLRELKKRCVDWWKREGKILFPTTGDA